MSETIIIRLPGAPRGKGRHRAQLVKRGEFTRIHSHPDQKTEAYEGALRLAAGLKMRGRAQLTGPLEVRIFAMLPIPASWSKRKRLTPSSAGCVPPPARLGQHREGHRRAEHDRLG